MAPTATTATAATGLSVAMRPRSSLLMPFVRSIGFDMAGEPPFRLERSLPSGEVSLMVNLHEDEFRTYRGPAHAAVDRVGGAMLAGPRTAAMVIDTAEQRHLVTVSFTPGGAAPFFGAPLAETRDRLVGLGELWGRDGAVLRERLLAAANPRHAAQIIETVLLDRVTSGRAAGPAGGAAHDPAGAGVVAFAVAAFEDGAAVSDVAAALGLLPKRFVRVFRDRTGLTPKRFARVRRLQRLLRAVHGHGAVNWAEMAAAYGYFDQAHLINDFRALTGLTPAAYLAAGGPAPNHVPVSCGS